MSKQKSVDDINKISFYLNYKLWLACVLLSIIAILVVIFSHKVPKDLAYIPSAICGMIAIFSLSIFSFTLARSKYLSPFNQYMLKALNNVYEGWIIAKAEEEIVYFTDNTKTLLNIQEGDLLEISSFFHIIKDRDAFQQFEALRSYISDGINHYIEIPVLVNNTQLWYKISTSKNHKYRLWKIEDITHIRILENTRKKREDIRNKFLNQNPAGYYVAYSHGEILFANETLLEWLGMRDYPNSGRGLDLTKIIAGFEHYNFGLTDSYETIAELIPSVGERFKAYIATRVDNENEMAYGLILKDKESVLLRTQESVKTVNISNQQASFNSPIHATTTIEKAVIPEPIYGNSPFGMALLSKDGKVIECNTAYLNLYGVRQIDVSSYHLNHRIKPEYHEMIEEKLNLFEKSNEVRVTFEAKITTRTDEKMVSFIAVRGDDYRSMERTREKCIYLFATDITKQTEMIRQLDRESKEQSVGLLVGGIAHDFNNMLATIIQSCDAAGAYILESDQSYQYLKAIEQTSIQATNLVFQLLSFTKSAGNNPKVINIKNVINNNWKLLQGVATVGRAIDIKLKDSRMALYNIRFDESKISQILLNLTVNARDAINESDRHGDIIIDIRNMTVEYDTNYNNVVVPKGNYVLLSVRDHGTGMTKEVQERIFEPYFSTKNRGQAKGTGLGLSTVLAIVQEGKSYITVTSEIDKFTEFKVFFPAYIESEEEQLIRTSDEQKIKTKKGADLTGNEKVLFVDDDDSLRTACCINLSRLGYNVVEAINGVDALEKIKEGFTPDVVLTDVTMPEMDGFTLSQNLNTMNPDLPIIIISGFSEDSVPPELANRNNVIFLPKPFNSKKLSQTIKTALSS